MLYSDPLCLDAMRDALRATPATEAPRARLAANRGPLPASAPPSTAAHAPTNQPAVLGRGYTWTRFARPRVPSAHQLQHRPAKRHHAW